MLLLTFGFLAILNSALASSPLDYQYILDNINSTRQANGRPTLCYSNKLGQAAVLNAQAQAAADNPLRTPDLNGAFLRVGFANTALGECSGTVSPDDWDAFYSKLLSDAGYRAIILDPAFTHFGVGKQASTTSGRTYYTLDFARAANYGEKCDLVSPPPPPSQTNSTNGQDGNLSGATQDPNDSFYGAPPNSGGSYLSAKSSSANVYISKDTYTTESETDWILNASSSTKLSGTNSSANLAGATSPSSSSLDGMDEDAQANALIAQYQAQIDQLKAQLKNLQNQVAASNPNANLY